MHQKVHAEKHMIKVVFTIALLFTIAFFSLVFWSALFLGGVGGSVAGSGFAPLGFWLCSTL